MSRSGGQMLYDALHEETPPSGSLAGGKCMAHLDRDDCGEDGTKDEDDGLPKEANTKDKLIRPDRVMGNDQTAWSKWANPFVPHTGTSWASMEIIRPPLTVRLPAKQGRAKWRPADAGAFPRRMERWATDQAVFATRGRKRGGTILVDAPGSMTLRPDQIQAVL